MSQTGNSLWTQLFSSSPSPCDRWKHACCSYDGSVYILGGRDNSCLRDFWRYNVVYNEWTELSCTSEHAPEEVEEHSMVAHEGFLYVFGGMLDSAYTKCKCALWVFDIGKQKWLHCQGKPSLHQAPMPSNRKGHSAVVIGSAMLMYGGFVDMKGSTQDFWSLNFDTRVWSQLSCSQNSSLGPGPRHSHSAMVYEGCMYLFGGLKGLQEQKDFWKWNSSTHVWSSLRTKSGPSKLIGHSAVLYMDSMLVFGGGESQGSPKNCLWRYSFTTQMWVQVTIHPGCNAPNKIHHCCVGLGSSYESKSCIPTTSLTLNEKLRPFNNKCFPASLTFLGGQGAIELETFSGDKCYNSKMFQKCSDLDSKQDFTVKDAHAIGNCLTFENQAIRKQWNSTNDDVLNKEDEDIIKHLPDLLLVLGGRPFTSHRPISLWHMTLTES